MISKRKRPRLQYAEPRLKAIDTRRLKLPPKQADPYYSSMKHRVWRDTVIARANGACETCGRTDVMLYADHIKELRDGGDPFDVSNGSALCGSCHTKKTLAERGKRARI